MNRQQVINDIVNDDLQTILNGGDDGEIYLISILEDGCQGWKNQKNEDLEIEYLQRFSPAYPDTFKITV